MDLIEQIFPPLTSTVLQGPRKVADNDPSGAGCANRHLGTEKEESIHEDDWRMADLDSRMEEVIEMFTPDEVAVAISNRVEAGGSLSDEEDLDHRFVCFLYF